MASGRKQKKEDKGGGVPLWMVTYGDMMTLLLCFFILLFSFSTLDLVKFRSVIVELQGALGVLSGGPMVLNLGDIPARQLTENPSASTRQMEQIQEEVEAKIEDAEMQGSIETILDERGLMIRFTDTVLFDLGKADIKPEAFPILEVVAQELALVSNPVRIEGHTDPTPIHTVEFPSNWELSTARATAIVHFMIESGGVPPERLSAAGFAFYHPVLPNATPEGRARNRRVDMIILKSDEESGENPVAEPEEEPGEESITPPPELLTGEPATPGVEPVNLLEITEDMLPDSDGEKQNTTEGGDENSETSEEANMEDQVDERQDLEGDDSSESG